MTGRGCGSVALFAVAALATYLSFVFTFEMETLDGLRENRADVAYFFLRAAAVATAAAMVVAGRRSRLAVLATACLAVSLVWRLNTLAPALHCGDSNSVARNADGTYNCFER
ncbi:MULTISPECIES: hypothetical protein [unclassified Streptomyces]|uniref:hypothetical protein n=1 Tax=unclassified Streptomyces TaxID=2593676 RepID=UPI002E296153|nr:hypothetical protein [Streptomyces sp. NBC_00306]